MGLTKQRKIELHLIEEGSITSWEAIEQYGVTRLSAIIYVLKDRGWTFETEDIEFEDRFGDKGVFTKYILKSIGKQSARAKK